MLDSVLFVQQARPGISPVYTWLTRAGSQVERCATDAEAVELATRISFDLIFIDFDTIDHESDSPRGAKSSLWDFRSSTHLLNLLRNGKVTAPILVQTHLEDEHYERLALDLGADDVIPKRAPLSVVTARVQAYLRRQSRDLGLHISKRSEIRIGHITLDRRGFRLLTDDVTITLAAREMRLLEVLAANPARVVPVPELLDAIATGETPSIRALSGLLRRLRIRMTEHGLPNPVESHRGRGFRLSSLINL